MYVLQLARATRMVAIFQFLIKSLSLAKLEYAFTLLMENLEELPLNSFAVA
jgi:hypothetical protein